jgi:ketosteroid isomerase-like protein
VLRGKGVVVSQENVEVVERVLATLRYTTPEELTDELLEELFTPDVEWLPVAQELRLADRYQGYEGMRRFFVAFLGIWEKFESHIEGVREVGDHVVTTLHVTGHRHGATLNEAWSALWTIESHRVVRMEGFARRSGASEAVGLEA